jgi:hypothetical protein
MFNNKDISSCFRSGFRISKMSVGKDIVAKTGIMDTHGVSKIPI